MPLAEDNTRVSIVIPKWLDEVLGAGAVRLGFTKSKFAYWLLLSGWGNAGLGYDAASVCSDDSSALFAWAAETKDLIREVIVDFQIMAMDEEHQQEIIERMVKRAEEREKKERGA